MLPLPILWYGNSIEILNASVKDLHILSLYIYCNTLLDSDLVFVIFLQLPMLVKLLVMLKKYHAQFIEELHFQQRV